MASAIDNRLCYNITDHLHTFFNENDITYFMVLDVSFAGLIAFIL